MLKNHDFGFVFEVVYIRSGTTSIMNMSVLVIFVFIFTYVSSAIVETEKGKIEGTTYALPNGRTLEVFFGIPYADPPIGINRFEEPKPVKYWGGVRNATFFRSPCVQFKYLLGSNKTRFEGDEDCLYLNVFTPKIPRKTEKHNLMNVMVYMHPGANMFGNCEDYYPNYLLQNNDIVFVNFNYRLGVLGFFSANNLIAPGNYALKDQVMALKWVQQNIRYFGGDPGKVTIYGPSSAGGSVHYHYISPLSEGLFQNGISSSGSLLHHWSLPKNVVKHSIKFAISLNCPVNEIRNMMRCLKRKSTQEIFSATKPLTRWKSFTEILFGPVIEPRSRKAFLTKNPLNLLKNGKIKNLPWMISVNEIEGLPMVFISYLLSSVVVKTPNAIFQNNNFFFKLEKPSVKLIKDENKFRIKIYIELAPYDEYLKEINDNWNTIAPTIFAYDYIQSNALKKDISREVKNYYFGNEDVSNQTLTKLAQVLGDRWFYNGINEATKLQASSTRKNVYCYKFKYRGSESYCTHYTKEKNLGTCHCDDQFYIINIEKRKSNRLTKTDRRMIEHMTTSVIAFMRNGNPNIGSITWEPVVKGGYTMNCLNIYSPTFQKMENIENVQTFRFWKNLLPSEHREDPS